MPRVFSRAALSPGFMTTLTIASTLFCPIDPLPVVSNCANTSSKRARFSSGERASVRPGRAGDGRADPDGRVGVDIARAWTRGRVDVWRGPLFFL